MVESASFMKAHALRPFANANSAPEEIYVKYVSIVQLIQVGT